MVFDWTVEPFGTSHDRSAFYCGNAALDEFLRGRVSQYEKRRLGKTFVAVPAGGKRVLGFSTLAAGSIVFEHLPPAAAKKLPKHPVPAVLLTRLAVDGGSRGMRLGEGLLLDALQRALTLSTSLGVHAVAVDAAAAAFYRKYGFTPLPGDGLSLYLPMVTVESQLG